MDDERIREFEDNLWKADAAFYREAIDEACLMVVPTLPYVLAGSEAVAAVADTPHLALGGKG